jgi:diaminobutyrate-2-oxoglutarate transaminase
MLRAAAIDYLMADGISAGLDFHTEAKLRFMRKFEERILAPRELRYRMQFPGPTGTNCVEAAIKLARKATGRTNIVAFTNGFHGMSLGALAATGSHAARSAASGLLSGVTRLPFDGYHGAGIDDLRRFEAMACDRSGGIDPIAAFIVETVQGEGGLNVATDTWLRELGAISRRLGALLIVDDIQAGCGRTGTFFSFERASLKPDLVCLAKSISGYGFPMSLLLIKPGYDVWKPGEHNGTFRGNCLAFVTAAAALDLWTDDFRGGLAARSDIVGGWCDKEASKFPHRLRAKGIGMMRGLEFSDPETAWRAARAASKAGVILECCGPEDQVLKIMAPLNIDLAELHEGLRRISAAIVQAFSQSESSDALHGRAPLYLERDEAPLDAYDDGSDPVRGAELPHGIA